MSLTIQVIKICINLVMQFGSSVKIMQENHLTCMDHI